MCIYMVRIMLYCVHLYQMYVFFLSVWPFLYIFLFSVVMNQKRHKCIRSVITVVLFNERYLILHNQHEDLRRTRSGPCVLCVTSLASSLGYSIDTVPCEVHSISAWVQFLKKN